MLKAVEFIKEKRRELNELLEKKERLLLECDQFGVGTPEFVEMDKLDEQLKEYETNWTIYEQFATELADLGQQEWIVFRSKTYLFDELLSSWTTKLKTNPQSPMSLRLLKDIDALREMSPCLKFCRGELLSPEHWLEMFRLLKLPRGTTLEKLTFGDLLGASQAIVANADAIKTLNARAQGEVAIREALVELDMWAASTDFSLTEYQHTNGTTIKLIREWKEAINSVKDSSALLQSLKNSPFYTLFSDKTSVWETRFPSNEISMKNNLDWVIWTCTCIR